MTAKRRERWFWAWLVQLTVAKAELTDPNAQVEVWENLVVLRAIDPKAAIEKAIQVGKSEAGDCRGTLRLNGRPAVTKCLGISDIGVIHDELADGAEILWKLKKCRQRTAMKFSKRKAELLSRLKEEVAHAPTIS